GGLCLALTKMNKIIEVNTDDFDCQVEAGVTWRDLNAYLHDTGLWFTVDPGASASLGGMASTCASGTNAVRYGTMKENVLNLEVVLSNGDIIHTNGELTRTRKSVAGYNLTNLFVGSEGTLGVITKVSLKLNPIPDIFLSVRCHFPTVKDATNTTIETLQSNVPVTKIELLDEFSMKATRKYRKSDLPENPTLFVEFNGNNQEVEYHCERFKEIAKENGCFDFNSTSVLEERNKLWKARHELLYALTNLKPNSTGISTDLCVPVSKLTEIIQKAQDMLREAQITGILLKLQILWTKRKYLKGGILGHVGDGNFHAILLLPKDDESEIQRLKRFANKLGEYALSLGGTCTGEHGIGIGKKELLKKQFNAESLELMKRLKKVIDPKNLMNPGKVFDLS
ncbi:putative D-lactate dehydrogenase-like protein, partial [Dinothrombium tinctorium]